MILTPKSDKLNGVPPPASLTFAARDITAWPFYSSNTLAGVFYLPTKRPTTHNNKRQPLTKVIVMNQREMPMLGDVKRNPDQIPQRLIEMCTTKQEAIQLCIKWSGIQDTVLATLMDIDKGNWSRIRTGSAHLPHNKENLLQDICGNEAILEWCNFSRNKKAIPLDPSDKIAELEEQLKQLKRAG